MNQNATLMKTRKHFLVALLLTLGLGQNVGIGTNAPTERLHVAGNLRLDGAFMPNDQPGAIGNILLSQGAGTPPAWLANGAVGTILTMGSSGPTWAPNPICASPTQNRFIKFTSTSPTEACNTTLAENANGNIWNADGNGSPLATGDKFEIIATGTFTNAINGYAYARSGIGVRGQATGTDGIGVRGQATGAGGTGVVGEATGGGLVGVFGVASGANGRGVVGSAPGDNGRGVYGGASGANGRGVHGAASAANGRGVHGEASGANGRGVHGAASGANGIGVFGDVSVANGIGVFGEAIGANGRGVYGITYQASGIGVQGVNTNANGTAGLFENTAAAGAGSGDGVIGVTQQSGGNGVYAYTANAASIGALWAVNGASAGTGTGLGAGIISRQRGGSALVANLRNDAQLQVTFFPNTVISAYHMGGVSGTTAPTGIIAQVASDDDNARAIVGQHTNTTTNVSAYSVYGYMDRGANSTGTNWAVGVYGYNPRTGANDWAVYSNGWFSATAGKGFFIDHPLDPENKYLLHATVEGPEPYNLYRGVVTTDVSGRAVVNLPDYFESANKDFSYYLQPIGTFAQVIVEEEVRNNEFVIRTDKPNVKVSWMVVATRNDPYMRYFWKPTVIEKSPEQRGKYLIPQVYGKDDSYGIFPGPVPSGKTPERSIPALPKNPEIKTPKSKK
jgi:hypothetical protein